MRTNEEVIKEYINQVKKAKTFEEVEEILGISGASPEAWTAWIVWQALYSDEKGGEDDPKHKI